MQHHHYSLSELENMMPWEREIYVALLMDYIKKNLPEDQLHKVFDIYLRILDSTRADIPNDLQKYWIENQERLGLKGKFLPDNSKVFAFNERAL